MSGTEENNSKVRILYEENKEFFIEISKLLAIVLSAIYISNKNYLLFHSAVESFCVIIAFSIFILAINTYKNSKNDFFMFLGIAFLVVGIFDFFHYLAYEGVGIFNFEDSINVAAQLWIVARCIQSVSLLLVCIFFYKNIKPIFFAVTYSIIAVAIIIILFYWREFPKCFIAGIGITLFKRISEYVIVLISIATIFLFTKNKNKLDKNIFKFLVIAIVYTIGSEISCTLYKTSTELPNMIGHIFKLSAFYYIYKATIQAFLKDPYNLLIRKLSLTENELNVVSSRLSSEKKEKLVLEKSLVQNEDCYNILIENSSDAIFIYNSGNILFVNNGAAKLMEIESKEELMDMNFFSIFHLEDIEADNGQLKRKFLSKITTTNEKTKDVEIDSTYIIYKGKPAVFSLVHDKSSSVEAERLQKDLDENEKLLNETLDNNKAIGEFTANIAHELRTPLNVIIGALQVIGLYTANLGDESSNMKNYLQIIKQNSYRLLRLVNNIVDMSKIDSGFFEIHLENHDIVNIVEELTLSVVPYIESKGVNLIFDTYIEEKIIACDTDKIERIMLNLLSNAAKFTDAGGEIKVDIKEGKGSIAIVVEDTGVGIPKEKLPLIFQRFKQVDKSFSRNNQGSGIGLSLVKSLVELHGGRVLVESEEGKGTKFSIELPDIILPSSENIEIGLHDSNKQIIKIELADLYSA